MRSLEEDGLGVYHGPIAKLAESYLPGKINDFSGEDFDKVLEHIDDGRPVWVIVTNTFDFLPKEEWETWKTEDGEIKVTYKMHSVLVTGYDDSHIYANDPLEDKNTQYSREEFIAGWEQIGKQAITYDS
jgi:uncharacterized protein YvpB